MTGDADDDRPSEHDPEIAPAASRLKAVQAELVAREPIFHRPEHGTDRRAFEAMTAEDFHEVGASGRRYDRCCVIDTLVERHATPHEDVWRADGFRCRELAPDVYLLTYDLLQDGVRRTRRATIWERAGDGWRIVYHQGTLVAADTE